MNAHLTQRPLNRKQRAFTELIAQGVDILEAFERAGYVTDGKEPRANARRLRADPRIRRYLSEIEADAQDIAGVRLARMLIEQASLALSNARNYYERDPVTNKLRMRDLTSLPTEMTAAISRLRFNDEGNLEEIFFHDKAGPIRDVIKHLGGYAGKGDQDQNVIPVQLQQLIIQLQSLPPPEQDGFVARLVAAASDSSSAESPGIAEVARSVALMLNLGARAKVTQARDKKIETLEGASNG